MTALLDGATLTPATVTRIARGQARAALAPQARERNAVAHAAVLELVAREAPLYGVTTGVGALRDQPSGDDDPREHQLRLLRSHACGAGPVLAPEIVRAAMAVRANQLGAGGAGVEPELLDALVAVLDAGLVPVTRRLGSLGTGDLTALADIGLTLLGEGRLADGDALLDAGIALRDAGIAPARLGPRDGIAFMSSNAVSAGHAALLVTDARALLQTWLAVAALSFEAAAADPAVLDARVHVARGQPGQIAVAARMRELLAGGLEERSRTAHDGPIQDPYPFRALPQVDGAVHDALEHLELTVTHELNAAAENALVVADEPVALPNGNPHAAPLAGALDALRLAIAQSAALIAARVSAMLDPALTGLPAFLARRPGPESGALILEYTAHSAAAEVRSLITPVAAQTVSVSRGVESHASLAPIAARRAHEALEALRVVVATELVVAVRALRLAGHGPAAAGTQELWTAAQERLDQDLADRPLAGDVEAARVLLDRRPAGDA